MATVSDVTKYSLRYTAASASGDNATSRLVSGLNLSSTTVPDAGAARTAAVTQLITTLRSFTIGTFSGFRWITESEVIE